MPTWPALAAIALAVALAGCSGGEETVSPEVAGPSQATETVAEISTTAAATTNAVASTTIPPTTTAVTPATVATTTPTASGPATGPYLPTTAPTFPNRTALPAGDGLPDGAYYAVVDGAAADTSPRLRVTIYELLTGPDAIAAAAADGVGLDGDLYVRAQPAVTREIVLTPEMALSVARPDQPGVSYAISPAELVRLVSGGAPNANAPDGYHYLEFPYLITALGGATTRFEQLWSP